MTEEMPTDNSNATHDTELRHGKNVPSAMANGKEIGAKGSVETNGTHTATMNGNSNGNIAKKDFGSTFYGHDREEVTRLLLQSLDDLGYASTAARLSQESGYRLESETVSAFRHAVKSGDWVRAEQILLNQHLDKNGHSEEAADEASWDQDRLSLVPDADLDEMKFLIREQRYIELLKRDMKSQALMVLQTELQPLNYDTRRLNGLSGMLISDKTETLDWDAIAKSRDKLLSELSKFVSPVAMLPQHRLVDLLDQVHRGQVSQCLYHNPTTTKPPSLFVDHMCDERDFPLHTSLELPHSDGEIWFVEFSHNGKFLVACGESRTAFIYETQDFKIHHRFSEHGSAVVYAAWSPDDTLLISCSQDAKARIWDVKSGQCLQVIDHHGQAVTSAAWCPDGISFVTGSLDRQAQLCLRTSDGQNPFNWPTDLRTQDCAITSNGQKLVAMSSDNYITVFDIPSRTEEYSIKVAHRMTCISVSRDSRSMLVNMANDEIHLIDIETADIVRRYTGQQQDGFIIRSTFGGSDEGLIISGSADSKVYIWHKENGTLIETLEGHSHGCVNSVSWNPRNPSMFASGGDDKKVRIWTKQPQQRLGSLRRRVSSHSSQRRSNYAISL